MICRRIGLKFLLTRRLVLSTIDLNNNKTNNGYNEWSNGSKRCVHSSNIHEIDYLVSRYRLTKHKTIQNYVQNNSSLAYFNTIDDFSFKTEKNIKSESLQNILNISTSDANKLIRNYPSLIEKSNQTLEKQYNILSSKYFLTIDQFMTCPWILNLPLSFIKERLDVFQNVRITDNHLVILLFPLPSFRKKSKRIIKKMDKIDNIFEDFNKRLLYFTKNLNITHEEFCDLIHDYMFFISYDFERLENVMNLLLIADIEPDIILNDITIFTHNIELIKSRIDECKRIEMPIKTWMLRSPIFPFEVCAKRHVENKKVPKDYTQKYEYLATQLNCDKELINFMVKKYPRIVTIGAKKLSNVISFLFGTGFSTYHIFDTPKIFFHKVEKIRKRMNQLKKIDVKPHNLKILTLSDSEYKKILNQLKTSIPVQEVDEEIENFKTRVSN